MASPGYREAFAATAKASHQEAEALLPEVSVPTMVVMGEQDPDFPDPAQEANWIGRQLRARRDDR